jgi:hypothetical protein
MGEIISIGFKLQEQENYARKIEMNLVLLDIQIATWGLARLAGRRHQHADFRRTLLAGYNVADDVKAKKERVPVVCSGAA